MKQIASRWAFRMLAMVMLCGASGRELLSQSSEGMVWPAPPAPAAVRFLASLPNPDAAPARPSFFQRLARALFSKEEDRIVRPLGLWEHQGTLYVTDPGGHSLVIFDQEKKSFERITKAGEDLLDSPVGVAAAKDRIFVSDSSLKKIFVFDRRGRFQRIFAGQGLERPTGLAWREQAGRLYVTDTAAHRVLIFSQDGRLEKMFGGRGTGPGEFNFPTHLWLDAQGLLFVVDSLNFRVQVFRPDGEFVSAFGQQGDGSGDFASPKGIAADSHGNLYVVDALFDAVQMFDSQGRLLLSFGERGTGPGQLWLPSGIFIDAQDRIYVADSYNHRVQVFEFLGGSGHVE